MRPAGIAPAALALAVPCVAAAAQGPPVPFAFEEVPPFECCGYGEWNVW